MLAMRKMALTRPANAYGFSSDSDFPTVYGVLVEWILDENKVTILSMRDGTASLYTTSTFGMLGGFQFESVRQLAVRCVKQGEQYVDSSKTVTDFPYPKRGQVFYYLLTYGGVRLCIGDESAIERESDPTLPLFGAAQDVLSELFRVTNKGDAQPDAPAPVEKSKGKNWIYFIIALLLVFVFRSFDLCNVKKLEYEDEVYESIRGSTQSNPVHLTDIIAFRQERELPSLKYEEIYPVIKRLIDSRKISEASHLHYYQIYSSKSSKSFTGFTSVEYSKCIVEQRQDKLKRDIARQRYQEMKRKRIERILEKRRRRFE